MCDDVVQRSSYSLKFVLDWFVTQVQLEIWHDDDDIALMMNLLSGIKGIKNGRFKKQK